MVYTCYASHPQHAEKVKHQILGSLPLTVYTVNTRYSTAVHFRRIWWINELGGLTGFHWYLYIILVMGNCGGLKRLVDKAVVD